MPINIEQVKVLDKNQFPLKESNYFETHTQAEREADAAGDLSQARILKQSYLMAKNEVVNQYNYFKEILSSQEILENSGYSGNEAKQHMSLYQSNVEWFDNNPIEDSQSRNSLFRSAARALGISTQEVMQRYEAGDY